MKHLNRLLAAAVALMMLTGCGTQTAPQQSAAEPAQTSAQETEAQEVSEAEAQAEEAPEAEAAEEPAEFDPATLQQITITSENLHDGVWDDAISNTDKGENQSPQLSWEPVDGAACYAVYMVDTTATFWLHWKSADMKWEKVEGASRYAVFMIDGEWLHMDVFTTETALAEGAFAKGERGAQYVGPYPPSGTHEYEIRIFALKEAVAEDKSQFDRSNYNFDDLVRALDEGSSGSGNVLAYGTLAGTFTRS